MTGGQHNRGEDYARVLCCCGYRIVSMTWEQYRAGVTPLCEHTDCADPARTLTRETNSRREGATAKPRPTQETSR